MATQEEKSVSQSTEPKTEAAAAAATATNTNATDAQAKDAAAAEADKSAQEASKASDSTDSIMVNEIRETLEEVFTLSNIESDTLLRSRMDKEGFIKLDYVLELPAIRNTLSTLVSLKETPRDDLILLLKRGINASRHLQFEVEGMENATLVRYVHNIERKTLIIRELSKTVTKKQVLSLFNEKPHSSYCGKVVSIKEDIGNNWFVNFESENDCLKSFKYLTENNIQLLGETLHVRVKSSASTHPLVGHGHGLPVENTARMSPNLRAAGGPGGIEAQPVGVSAYVQSSPILHHTGMTPYGPVSYEQHAYDQMYKTGSTPPPQPETQAIYDNIISAQAQAAQAAQVQAAQAQAQAQQQQMMRQQQEMLQQQQQMVQQRQQRQQARDRDQRERERMERENERQQRQYEQQQQQQQQQRPPQQQISDMGPAGVGVGVGEADIGITGGVTPPAPGSRAPGGQVHRQPTCDYPSQNFAKYTQKMFMDIYEQLKNNDDLGIPHEMAGRDHRVVSEEVKIPVYLMPVQVKKKKANENAGDEDEDGDVNENEDGSGHEEDDTGDEDDYDDENSESYDDDYDGEYDDRRYYDDRDRYNGYDGRYGRREYDRRMSDLDLGPSHHSRDYYEYDYDYGGNGGGSGNGRGRGRDGRRRRGDYYDEYGNGNDYYYGGSGKNSGRSGYYSERRTRGGGGGGYDYDYGGGYYGGKYDRRNNGNGNGNGSYYYDNSDARYYRRKNDKYYDNYDYDYDYNYDDYNNSNNNNNNRKNAKSSRNKRSTTYKNSSNNKNYARKSQGNQNKNSKSTNKKGTSKQKNSGNVRKSNNQNNPNQQRRARQPRKKAHFVYKPKQRNNNNNNDTKNQNIDDVSQKEDVKTT